MKDRIKKWETKINRYFSEKEVRIAIKYKKNAYHLWSSEKLKLKLQWETSEKMTEW